MNQTSITISPRFYETDAMGHINNASLAAWMETSRITFMESFSEGTGYSAMNWLLASLKIDYLDETFYGTDVTSRITGARVGNSSLTLECEFWQQQRLTLRGVSVLVHMDMTVKKSARIPDQLRGCIDRALDE